MVKLTRLCLAHPVAQATLAKRASPPVATFRLVKQLFQHENTDGHTSSVFTENNNVFILQGLTVRQAVVMLDAKLAWLLCARLFWLACEITPCILLSLKTWSGYGYDMYFLITNQTK